MNVSQFFPSKYVKAPDLNGREVTVEIDRVAVEKVGAPPKIEDKLVLYFRKATKGMILNKVNAMTIAAMYSPETENWSGRRVTLYPTRVQAFGAMHEVIRVKPMEPPNSSAAPEPPHFDDAEDVIDNEDVDDVMATGTPAPDSAEAALHELRTVCNELGNELYGDTWASVAKRNAGRVSKGSGSIDELTPDQLQQLITGMNKLKASRANIASATQEAIPSTSSGQAQSVTA